MSLHDPTDKNIYQFMSLGTSRFSHGRILLEGWDKVITIKNGCYMQFEINKPSKRDPNPQISIILKGGNWSIDDKISKTAKSSLTARAGSRLTLGIFDHNLKGEEDGITK